MLTVENVRYKNSRVNTVNNNVLELRKCVRVENNRCLYTDVQNAYNVCNMSRTWGKSRDMP